MFTQTTRSVKITVLPAYLEGQSSPANEHFVWAYTIHVENLGQETVQLINRYWHITDAHGRVEEVHGPGVVGEQPTLRPGEMFQYTSGVALHTPSGIMQGHYEMKAAEDEFFPVVIPTFSLDSPQQLGRPN